MSAEQQQDLLLAVQATVVKHLASRSAAKVVTISMSPNNGYKPLDEPDREPEPDKPYEPDRQPEPDQPPPKPESAGRR